MDDPDLVIAERDRHMGGAALRRALGDYGRGGRKKPHHQGAMRDAPFICGGARIGLVHVDGRMVAADVGEAQNIGLTDGARIFGRLADLDMRLDRHLVLPGLFRHLHKAPAFARSSAMLRLGRRIARGDMCASPPDHDVEGLDTRARPPRMTTERWSLPRRASTRPLVTFVLSTANDGLVNSRSIY